MKNYIFALSLTIAFFSISPLFAMEEENPSNCFLIKSKEKFFVQEGQKDERHPPACMFNMAFAVMGFNEKALIDEKEPEWPYKESYKATREELKHPHNPTSWMKNSSVWFSQVLVENLGIETVQRYLCDLNYGNKDVSRYEKSETNDLPTPFWISSSFKISPLEQLHFIERLVESSLPVSPEAQRLARNILYIEELSPGWMLYGKTGAGTLSKTDDSENVEYKYGWFAGWLQKDKETFTFVRYLEDKRPGADYPSPEAKRQVKEKLRELIGNL